MTFYQCQVSAGNGTERNQQHEADPDENFVIFFEIQVYGVSA